MCVLKRVDVTELNWHGLFFDELSNGQTGRVRQCLL